MNYNNFRLITILTITVLVINFISIAIFVKPVEAENISEIRYTISNNIVSNNGVTHSISFFPNFEIQKGMGIVLIVPDAFNDYKLTKYDYSLKQRKGEILVKNLDYDHIKGLMQFEIEKEGDNNKEEITINIFRNLNNPIKPGKYNFVIETVDLGSDLIFSNDDTVKETGSFSINIVSNTFLSLPKY